MVNYEELLYPMLNKFDSVLETMRSQGSSKIIRKMKADKWEPGCTVFFKPKDLEELQEYGCRDEDIDSSIMRYVNAELY